MVRLKFGFFTPLFFLASILLSFSACSPGTAYNRRYDQAVAAMDKRNYPEAEKILAEMMAKYPGEPKVRTLLAEAHLGVGGFAMLDLIDQILGPQDFEGSSNAAEPTQKLTPNSINFVTEILFINLGCTRERIKDPKLYSKKGCLILRFFRALPTKENFKLGQARDLLNQSFPDPSLTPIDVNFLMSYVNVLSAASRLKQMVSLPFINEVGSPIPFQSHWGLLFKQLKLLREEGLTALTRAAHSYHKVTNFVGQIYGKSVIQVGDRSLIFDEKINYSDLYTFVTGLIYDHRQEIDAKLQNLLLGKLKVLMNKTRFFTAQATENKQGHKFKNLTDLTALTSEDWAARAVEKVTQPLYDLYKKTPGMNWAEFVFDNPPRLYLRIQDGLVDSWNREQDDPLNNALHISANQFGSLEEVIHEWNVWSHTYLEREEQKYLMLWDLAEAYLEHGQETALPERWDGAAILTWESQIADLLANELQKIGEGKLAPGIPVNDTFTIRGKNLIQHAQAWIHVNLWSPGDFR